MKISIICAMDEKHGIGRDNKLLWHIPEDLKSFKELTSGHPIIMGRKTFESIGRVLPNRTNIIITRDQNYKVEGAVVVHSLEQGIEEAKKAPGAEEIFIIGGGQIFQQSLPLAQRLYLTIVARLPSLGGEATGGQDGNFDADTFFPDYSMFRKKTFEEKGEHNGLLYAFVNLEK